MRHDVFSPHSLNSSRSSSVTIVTEARAERSEGSNPGTWKRSLSSPKVPYRRWRRPSLLFNGYRRFSWGLKRPGLEAEHSPSSNATIRRSTSAPPISLHGADRDNFTVFFTVMFLQFCVFFHRPTSRTCQVINPLSANVENMVSSE